MKIIAYSIISGILFISLLSTVQACDDEIIDASSLYDAYEFEAVDD